MNKKDQISIIERFLISDEQTIIINQVNEEIGIFYLEIIRYYAEKNRINISIDQGDEFMGSEDDLFGLKEIKVYNITNKNKIAAVLNSDNKKIVFTDYKNYKKLNTKNNCINGYKFEYDIVFFIEHELKINNDELLYYCKNNPALLFSEISKYIINNNQYISDQGRIAEKNHILNLRKSIFEIKKNNLNVKNLYLNIKKEAMYKKLSFLIY